VALAQGSRNRSVAAAVVEVMVEWLQRYPFFPAFKVVTLPGQGRGQAGSSITAHEMHHMAFGPGWDSHTFMPDEVDGMCTQEMQEGIVQRRDTRDDTPAYRSEEERSYLNVFQLHWGYPLATNVVKN
jgi:hypothetical protein